MSKRRLLFVIQVIAVISLVVAGLVFFNVKYDSEHYGDLTLGGTVFLQPNDTMANNDFVPTRSFHTNTTIANYRVSFRIDITTNAAMWIQLVGGNTDGTPQPSMDKLPSGGYLLYNQTHTGPYQSEQGTKIGYTIQVPISPVEPGYKYGNNGSPYEVRIANLGKVSPSGETLPNNTASVNLQTKSPYIEETDYPYYYHGVAFMAIAIITAVLPYLPLLARKTAKTLYHN